MFTVFRRVIGHSPDGAPIHPLTGPQGAYNSQGDLLVNATADGVNLDSIWEELTAALALFYAERNAYAQLLSFSTTAIAEPLAQAIGSERFDVASEFRSADLRPSGRRRAAFPPGHRRVHGPRLRHHHAEHLRPPVRRRPHCRDGDTRLRKMPMSSPAAVDGNIACRQLWWCPPASWHWARSSDCCRASIPDPPSDRSRLVSLV